MRSARKEERNSKRLTLRVPEELAKGLERERRRRGCSLDQLAIDLVAEALEHREDGRISNGLAELAGSWSAEELAEFERATAQFDPVDDELWT